MKTYTRKCDGAAQSDCPHPWDCTVDCHFNTASLGEFGFVQVNSDNSDNSDPHAAPKSRLGRAWETLGDVFFYCIEKCWLPVFLAFAAAVVVAGWNVFVSLSAYYGW